MKKNDESDFEVLGETGEIYMLTKKERILTIELLKVALATEGGREFLEYRFGNEGLEIAESLLSQMGVKIGNAHGPNPRNVP